MSYTYNSSTDFYRPSESAPYNLPFSKVESYIFKKCSFETERDVFDYLEDVERAKVKWACITSKSQRTQNDRWLLEVYENVTKLKPYIENVSYQQPPDRTGRPVQKFSQKSRSRMMDRFRRMKKDSLKLPFFVTLTYHRNELRGDVAKKHLNTFLQRFRRLSDEKSPFRYFWKMEKQKRGAIHFHLMLWIPEKMFPAGWNSDQKIPGKKETTLQNEYLKLRVSAAWNEIAEPGDNKHLKAGTNCRPVFSWRMCTGYLSKYMEKPVCESDFQQKNIVGGFNPEKRSSYSFIGFPDTENRQTAHFEGNKKKSRCIKVSSTETSSENPGRFWGFSNNFDFSACYKGETDIKNIYIVRKHLRNIQKVAFKQYLDYEKSEVNRIQASNFSHKKKQSRLKKIKERVKNQRRRAVVNIEKIDRGAFIQIEVAQKYAFEALRKGGT